MSKRAEDKALKYEKSLDYYHYTNDNPSIAFRAGYEQAEKDTIERAIQWLIAHADDYIVDMEVSRYNPSKLHVGGMCWEHLKQAMEEE